MNYHAHVYWKNNHERDIALSLHFQLEEYGCKIGRIWDKAIGPHPLPMYQVYYNSSNQNLVESYLQSQSLTVLLHEDIGVDHVRDHTEGARWIGEQLELDLKFLENFQDD